MQLLLSPRARCTSRSFCPSKCLKALMECPLNSLLNRLIKHIWQEWHGSQSQPNRSPGADPYVLAILQRAARVSHDAVDSKGGQTHRSDTLKDGTLHHHCPVIFQRSHDAWFHGCDSGISGDLDRFRRIVITRLNGFTGEFGVYDALVCTVGFVSLMGYVADQVGPRDAVGSADEVWMGNRPEGFPNI
jgi:hypothetical protein